MSTIVEQLMSNRERLDRARQDAVERVLLAHGKAAGGYHNQRLVEDVAAAVQEAVFATVVSALS